jgi:hypothetical protein
VNKRWKKYFSTAATVAAKDNNGFDSSHRLEHGNLNKTGSNSCQCEPGVDAMITLFYDFCKFSAKKWRFSKKPML